MAMLPGNPNGMIFLKVVTEDGATKTIRCEPSTTIAEIKEQFSYRLNPNEHRICFADGRVGEENSPIGQYGVEQNAFIFLRNKNLTQRRGSVGPRPAWAETGLQSTVISEKPVLDDDADGRMGKLKQFISHFLKRRPSPQQLVDAKILNEAPVVNNSAPPNFEDIQRSIEWLRRYALRVEGLFRVSGSAQENTNFCDKLVNHKLDIESYTPDRLNPHAVTTGLKIYFREKTAPVIPYKYYKEYMDNYRRSDKSAESVRQNCQHMISTLPENNRRILVFLCKFLSELATHESENKMNTHNLGVVFGPTLMRTESTGLESLTECDTQIAIVEELIMHINEIDPSAVVSPDSVPSACGSANAAAPKAPLVNRYSSVSAAPKLISTSQPAPSGGVTAPPPMLMVPKNGPGPKMMRPNPGERKTSYAGARPPVNQNQQQQQPPKMPAPGPTPGSPTVARPPEMPGGQPMPPGMRPQGAGPTPGKPPMGHAPVPGAGPSSGQPIAPGNKLKLVPKFKVTPRAAGTGAPQTPTGSQNRSAGGIQQEMQAALAAPNDLQKTKTVAAQLSNMFETQPQETSDMLNSDIATTANFILLLGRCIATSA